MSDSKIKTLAVKWYDADINVQIAQKNATAAEQILEDARAKRAVYRGELNETVGHNIEHRCILISSKTAVIVRYIHGGRNAVIAEELIT